MTPNPSIEIKAVNPKVGLFKTVSLELEGPKIIGITGPNGSGKSSLLRLLTGLNSENNSAISLCGVSLSDLSARERARRIAYLPQSPSISVPST